MCGRLNITDDPLTQIVSDLVGISFSPQLSLDLKPSETVSAIIFHQGGYQQRDVRWGIKPDWAKRMIINAQVESVAHKLTFKRGFESQRVLVPCSGWYEWREEARLKHKYLFSNPDNTPLFMAGIIVDSHHLVTLTTAANPQCAEYHHRMPFLVPQIGIEQWLCSSASEAQTYLSIPWRSPFAVKLCGE
ncbi:hypothetical protein EGH82_21570 [Vibrio ponticus]|uniref:Abasic site processing protein n=2 Tax=Vibrio ponticus TaxID=265668 RepID=A0A3N3DTC3_9VIBR|nr:hypothetical protein EGH82_21570 [Vibrio ponticus]